MMTMLYKHYNSQFQQGAMAGKNGTYHLIAIEKFRKLQGVRVLRKKNVIFYRTHISSPHLS